MTWGLSGAVLGDRAEPVALEVRPGQVVAVVGPDGSGKSTLLRALVGAVALPSGAVSRPERREIGFMGASSGTYPDLSVDENVAFTASAYGMSAEEAREGSRDMIEHMGLSGARDRLAGQLSGGMRQKLGAICAMVHRPRMLVMDEPTTGIDPVSRADLWRLIAQAAARGAAVVVSTSYLDEAERASEVVALDGISGAVQTMPRAELRADVSTTVLAEVRHVSRTFGTNLVVDDVDLEVHPGEVFGLLGPNGAGKTTLIRMLLGLLRATSGEVLLFGERPSRSTRKRLGYVPQSLGLYDDLTPRENMAFSASAFEIPAPPLPSELDRSQTVGDLSRGLQRRVAFAQALAHSPDLLILDEPTSGVHPEAAAGLWTSVREATAGGAGALVTTHSMSEASECDRLAIMAEGRVVAAGTLAQIVGDSRTLVIEAPDWAEAFSLLDSAGIHSALVGNELRVPVEEESRTAAALSGLSGVGTRVEPATLEERFLQLTSRVASPA